MTRSSSVRKKLDVSAGASGVLEVKREKMQQGEPNQSMGLSSFENSMKGKHEIRAGDKRDDLIGLGGSCEIESPTERANGAVEKKIVFNESKSPERLEEGSSLSYGVRLNHKDTGATYATCAEEEQEGMKSNSESDEESVESVHSIESESSSAGNSSRGDDVATETTNSLERVSSKAKVNGVYDACVGNNGVVAKQLTERLNGYADKEFRQLNNKSSLQDTSNELKHARSQPGLKMSRKVVSSASSASTEDIHEVPSDPTRLHSELDSLDELEPMSAPTGPVYAKIAQKPSMKSDDESERPKNKKRLSWMDQKQSKSLYSGSREKLNHETRSLSYDSALDEEPELDEEYKKDLYNTGEDTEEFYARIFAQWAIQDKLVRQRPSVFSTILWMPVLIALRVFNTVMRGIMFPINLFSDFVMPFASSRFNYTKAIRIYRVRDSERKRRSVSEFPVEYRKQAAIVFAFIMMLPLIMVSGFMTMVFILFPLTTVPMIIYLIYIFRIDKSPENGSRIAWLRYHPMWRHFVNYFPIRLVKTYNLDPKQKYVFCYHPHGIISFGAFANFATDATGFSRLFPGINLRLLTLGTNFFVPWIREFLLSMGICSCSKKSCNNILQRGPGNSIMLVVGGADESLHASPGTYRLNVNGRKGFVRVAIENQAQLVPVLGFGENDAFTTVVWEKGSWIRNLQEDFKSKFGFATPIFWGRDMAHEKVFGILPHRTPIIAVVGKPLPLPKVPAHLRGDLLRTTSEGRAIVNRYHKQYLLALKALYDNFKDKWAINRSESMLFMQQGNMEY